MIGYKAFDRNFTCRGFHYKVGKTYEFDGNIELCKAGFHFCENIADCFSYYYGRRTRFAKVEALGKVIRSDDDTSKCVTDKIRIIEEIPLDEAIRMSNSGFGNTGINNPGDRNTGNSNIGNWNTGYRNTGSWNTGDRNIGECNVGNRNLGNSNTGYWNTGTGNVGDRNTGNGNSGKRNAGDRNVGDFNSGDRNSGDWNAGSWNTGNSNAGNFNVGNWNTGNLNTGDFNKSSSNTGCFMTRSHTIMMFNKPSTWTIADWRRSEAYRIMHSYPVDYTDANWVLSSEMTNKEKAEHPEYTVTDGYLKVEKHKADKQKWWDGLSSSDKRVVMDLPNFDADVFFECTGIRV
jgi:hypothetical protein